MKQKDIAMIILIAAFAAMVSFFTSRLVFAGGQDMQSVEVVEPISTDFNLPSGKYFNADSIDPTQLIQIGNNNNENPFNGSHQ